MDYTEIKKRIELGEEIIMKSDQWGVIEFRQDPDIETRPNWVGRYQLWHNGVFKSFKSFLGFYKHLVKLVEKYRFAEEVEL